jgi:phosphatidylglycerophosphate synthase
MVNKLEDHHECPLDIYLFKFIDQHLHLYYKLGLTPNMVTSLALFFGLFAAYQIIQGNYIIAAVSWIISYYLDCVDGKLARKYNMITKFGDYYDHFCDLTKYIVVFIALFYSKSKRTTDRQWFLFFIVLLLAFMSCVHLGYQECLYNKKEESSFLNIYRAIVSFDSKPEKTIQYTRHFGCATWILCVALLIIFWHK